MEEKYYKMLKGDFHIQRHGKHLFAGQTAHHCKLQYSRGPLKAAFLIGLTLAAKYKLQSLSSIKHVAKIEWQTFLS